MIASSYVMGFAHIMQAIVFMKTVLELQPELSVLLTCNGNKINFAYF